jgi:hypothetical protein
MGILGILTCEILELEFSNLLGTDTDVSRITVLEEMRRNSGPFNERFGFRTEVREGTLGLLKKTWDSAKAFLICKTD